MAFFFGGLNIRLVGFRVVGGSGKYLFEKKIALSITVESLYTHNRGIFQGNFFWNPAESHQANI